MANTEHRELITAIRDIRDAIKDLTKEIRKTARDGRQADEETETAPPVPSALIGDLLNKNTYGGSKGGVKE